MNASSLFFLALAADKAAPSRPSLEAGKYAGAAYSVRDLSTGEEVTLRYDGVTVGADTSATATASVSMYAVLSRALRLTGCTRDAVARLVTEATAAELRGEVDPDEAEVKATVETLRAAFAASLPKVPRAGAIKVAGPAFVAAGEVIALAAK